jgi:aryl-alcohol dehydrogenase
MKTKTIAAVVHAKDAPFSEEVELDEPRPNEVLVRMVATGLCHTDLSVRSGALPFPLPGIVGHEGAGVVEAVGSAVQRVQPGDHILASFTSCGACTNCQGGDPVYCTTWFPLNLLGGRRADGSHTVEQNGTPLNAHFFGQSTFARHALIDERSLVKVSPDAPLEILAPLGCGIQTGAGAVLNVLRPGPGSSLAVFGIGGVGLAAIMAAKLTAAGKIIAIDLVPERLALAKELGATDTVDARSTDAHQALMDLTAGQGVNYAIEATGNTTVLSQAIQSLAALGACVVFGAPPAGSTVPFDVLHLINGRRIIGVNQGNSVPEIFIPTLVQLYESGRFPLDRLIRYYPFEQMEQAATDALNGVSIKPVLTYS